MNLWCRFRCQGFMLDHFSVHANTIPPCRSLRSNSKTSSMNWKQADHLDDVPGKSCKRSALC